MAEPKVRFKRDDGSSYPAWVAGKLGDITTKVDRKAPKGSVAPVMMVSQGNGFIYQADKYSRENAGQSLKNYTLLKQGEFAYNHGASKAKPYGVAYCLTEEPEARVPFVYHTFKLKDGVSSYWHQALNTSKMDRQLKRLVSSGARMDGLLNINYETYMDVDINIPCVEEQQKIADFLSSVDEVIAASEEEVVNLETQKKAVMKKLFSREVRFKREDGSDFLEWEEMNFDQLADYKKGPFGSALKKELFVPQSDDTVKVYEQQNAIGKDWKLERYFITAEYARKMKGFEVHSGDIIISCAGTIGEIYELPVGAEPGIINQALMRVRVDETVINKYYFSCVFDMMITTEGSRISNGSALKNIPPFADLKKQVVSIPCLEEQRLIADFLSNFDEAIAAAKKELELWKELKKGLLQQMFV